MSFSIHIDPINAELIAAHVASGQPRYSITLHLAGGGLIRRWTSDQDAALIEHGLAKAAAGMERVVTFDHLEIDSLAVDTVAHGKTAQQLRAECDAALDAMIDRWTWR
jgi:hypothetical protein